MFHTHEGASLICDEIQAYEPTTLEDVRVIAYSDRERDIYGNSRTTGSTPRQSTEWCFKPVLVGPLLQRREGSINT